MASDRLIDDLGRSLRLARAQVEELPHFNEGKVPFTRQVENDVVPAVHTIPPVPSHLEIITRNEITLLMQPSDIVCRNGDIALTTWGGLMLNNEDFSAFHRLVEQWRYNYPTLRVLFDTTFSAFKEQEFLEPKRGDNFATLAHNPITSVRGRVIDAGRFLRAIDERGAEEMARGTYAGTVVIVVSKILSSFRVNISANKDEWKKSAPLFEGCSVGQIVEAAANNVRHNEEWAKMRRPTERQMASIKVLAAALNEPVAIDSGGHQFSREICPEILHLLSAGAFQRFESTIFMFAKNMMAERQRRLPVQ